MYRKPHGLHLCRCIITNENTTLDEKKRRSSYAVKLAKMLGDEV
jgi:glycine reductase